MHVLIVEDELAIREVLVAYFKQAGFTVSIAKDGQLALQRWKQLPIDCILLDIRMPFVDGWTVLETIRATSDVPILMLTALDDVPERIKGLEKGADDYISKPFHPDEVVARTKAVLRRTTSVASQSIQLGDLVLDVEQFRVTLQGNTLQLIPKDFALLAFFMQHPNQLFSREQLLDEVWGQDFDGSDRAVDVAIKRLRQALGEWPKEQGEIRTVRGMGYQLYVPS